MYGKDWIDADDTWVDDKHGLLDTCTLLKLYVYYKESYEFITVNCRITAFASLWKAHTKITMRRWKNAAHFIKCRQIYGWFCVRKMFDWICALSEKKTWQLCHSVVTDHLFSFSLKDECSWVLTVMTNYQGCARHLLAETETRPVMHTSRDRDKTLWVLSWRQTIDKVGQLLGRG